MIEGESTPCGALAMQEIRLASDQRDNTPAGRAFAHAAGGWAVAEFLAHDGYIPQPTCVYRYWIAAVTGVAR
jgi:hypothetical protein